MAGYVLIASIGCKRRGYHKLDEMVIMPILASKALLHKRNKNPETKCYIHLVRMNPGP